MSERFIYHCKQAINAKDASTFNINIRQLVFCEVCFWELKQIFTYDFIQEGLCPESFKHKVTNPVALERITDKLRMMWREKILATTQEEIQKEYVLALRAKLKAKGINLDATEKGKILVKEMWALAKPNENETNKREVKDNE